MEGSTSPTSSMTVRGVATGEPLDFSFCELLDMVDALHEKPRSGRTLKMVSLSCVSQWAGALACGGRVGTDLTQVVSRVHPLQGWLCQ
jgi:hypothetical protein